MSARNALIVDDEPEIREALREEMMLENWQVWTVADGQQALDMLGKQAFQVIISDISMPNVNGVELLQEIRRRHHNLVFVLMSAYADIPIWNAYAYGADAFLGKPFRVEDLDDLLKRLFLPLRQRWSDPGKVRHQLKITAHIDQTCATQQCFSLGRGGFFLETIATQLRKGQFVSFHVKYTNFVLDGIGRLAWKRQNPESGLRPGLGIEFIYLEEPCRQLICDAIEKSRERAVIPLGEVTP